MLDVIKKLIIKRKMQTRIRSKFLLSVFFQALSYRSVSDLDKSVNEPYANVSTP